MTTDLDDSAMWREHRERVKSRHQFWYEENLAILRASDIPFKLTPDGTCCLFRQEGKPKVDFYPHTGRWRVPAKHTGTFRGQAKAFLAWYAKQ